MPSAKMVPNGHLAARQLVLMGNRIRIYLRLSTVPDQKPANQDRSVSNPKQAAIAETEQMQRPSRVWLTLATTSQTNKHLANVLKHIQASGCLQGQEIL